MEGIGKVRAEVRPHGVELGVLPPEDQNMLQMELALMAYGREHEGVNIDPLHPYENDESVFNAAMTWWSDHGPDEPSKADRYRAYLNDAAHAHEPIDLADPNSLAEILAVAVAHAGSDNPRAELPPTIH